MESAQIESQKASRSRQEPEKARLRAVHEAATEGLSVFLEGRTQDLATLLACCLSYRDLAKIAGCSEDWLRRQRAHGLLRTRRVGGKVMIRLVDWIAFLERPEFDDPACL